MSISGILRAFSVQIYPRFTLPHFVERRDADLDSVRGDHDRERWVTNSTFCLKHFRSLSQGPQAIHIVGIMSALSSYLFDIGYSIINCMSCFPSSPNLKVNGRSFKILRLLGEVSMPSSDNNSAGREPARSSPALPCRVDAQRASRQTRPLFPRSMARLKVLH